MCGQESVAVKCIARSKLTTEQTHFLEEIDTLSTIDHPHVVQLFGVAASNDSFMLVCIYFTFSLQVKCHMATSLRALNETQTANCPQSVASPCFIHH